MASCHFSGVRYGFILVGLGMDLGLIEGALNLTRKGFVTPIIFVS